MQDVKGYAYTIIRGVVTFIDNEPYYNLPPTELYKNILSPSFPFYMPPHLSLEVRECMHTPSRSRSLFHSLTHPLSLPPQVLLNKFSERDSQVEKISQMALFPDEALLFDPNSVPIGRYHHDRSQSTTLVAFYFFVSTVSRTHVDPMYTRGIPGV